MPAPIAPRPAKPMRSMSLNSPPRQLSMRRAVQHSRREPERTRSGAVERTGLKMADDATQIRTLIERWADAVHGGDMDHVLADHADDIVMFDVPPPYEGVRGIDAYRETWPPFFEWQLRGASFEIVS